MPNKRIVCFGPGPRFKGGIANYNTSLAKALDQAPNTEVFIVSWTQQYPSIIPREFEDKKSKTDDLLKGTNVQVKYLTNYNNPLSWQATYRYIRDLKPDIVIFQWAITIQGLPLGRIARMLRKHSGIEIIFDLHNIVQKENSPIDKNFTKYGIEAAHTYIVHSHLTVQELAEFYEHRKNFYVTTTGRRKPDSGNTIIKLYHPVYDMFEPKADFDVAAFKQKHGLRKHVFLFFGFIRKYKGLHNAIKAFKKVASERNDVSLLICGESFWNTLDNTKLSTKVKEKVFGFVKKIMVKKEDDERHYRPLDLIHTLSLQDQTVVFNDFIPNEEVHQYFQASDCVVLYYTYATPSGILSISYNFELPILATKVGAFPELIEHGVDGYLAKDNDIEDMAQQMRSFIEKPIPAENVVEKAKSLSWENYAKAILQGNI